MNCESVILPQSSTQDSIENHANNNAHNGLNGIGHNTSNGYAWIEYKVFGDKVACYDDKATYNGCHQGRCSCLIVIDSTDKIAFNAFHHEGDWYKDCVAEE